MRKPWMRKEAHMHTPLWFVFTCLVVFFLAACGSNGGTGSTPTPTAAPFKVASVDLAVSPNSIAGKTCGSSASFTYTATFHIPAATAGGTIQFMYTLNNGRSSTNAGVTVGPGETTKTFTFTSSGMLLPDNTYPGLAGVIVTSPNSVSSPMVKPAGVCTQVPVFKVLTIDMAVSPESITGTSCRTTITVTYSATFHLVPNGLGGTIQFMYTTNNGRSSTNASITVGPGQTIAKYSFTWTGQVTAGHVYPGPGGVMTTSPNAVSSALVKPQGVCS